MHGQICQAEEYSNLNMNFDILIKNGTIIDGTGNIRYNADVGISKKKIAAIGNLVQSQAHTIIDATDLIIAPGFIDMHSHSDVTLLDDPGGESKAFQGVTTEVVGNCGFSPYPIIKNNSKEDISPMASRYPLTWENLDSWACSLQSNGISLNIAPQVGHSAIRYAVGLIDNNPPSKEQLNKMCKLVFESIEQGAFSFSTGLTVAPSMYAKTEEIVELAKTLSEFEGAFYVSHARLWAGNHIKAVEEAIDIGKQANIPVQYSHMAIIDSRYYGTGEQMVKPIEIARSLGIDATYDVYPYTAAGTNLAQSVPSWLQEGGEHTMLKRLRNPSEFNKALKDIKKGHFGGLPWAFDTFVISYVKNESNQNIVGKSIEQIAIERNEDPHKTYLSLIEEEDNQVGVVVHNRVESDVRYFLSHPLAMIGSDGNAISPTGIHAKEKPHPRFYGTYPRILGKYVRDESLISLETAIHKMTGMPAKRLNLKDRGYIIENKLADIAIFNPLTIIDKSTFNKPHQLSKGIVHLFVNGTPIISNGKHTNKKPGVIIRRI